MKDVTSTSFGLLIAFLLPGFVALYSLSFWSKTLRSVFATFLTVNSNVGLSIVVILGALAVGLIVTPFRWLIFERLICRRDNLPPAYFEKLDSESKLVRFRAVVDEHYRYHQFWGAMVIVMPFFSAGVMREYWTELTGFGVSLCVAAVVVVEATTVAAACVAFRNYVTRAKHIVRGEGDA